MVNDQKLLRAEVSLLTALILCFVPRAVIAASPTPTGITIAPPFTEIVLASSQAKSTAIISLTNGTSSHQSVSISVLDFGALDESGGVAFAGVRGSALQQSYSLASWVSLEKDLLEVDPGQTKEITVTILNKASLAPGGHYAAVVAASMDEKTNGQSVGLRSALASLMFVKKTGGEIYGLSLAGTETTKRWLWLPTAINLRFQNTGNVHVVPRGTVTVTGPWDWEIYKGIINPASGIILPESFRVYPTSLERLSFPLWPGMYALTVQYRWETQNEQVTQTTRFFHPGLVGIGFVSLIIILVIFRLASFARHSLARLKS